MVVALQGPEKLLQIHSQVAPKSLIFVVSPVSKKELDFSAVLVAAQNHDPKLWSLVEQLRESWSEAVASDAVGAQVQDEVLQTVEQGFTEIENLLMSIRLTQEISAGARKYVDIITSQWAALILHLALQSSGVSSRLLAIKDVVNDQNFALAAEEVVVVCGELEQSASSPDDRDAEYSASLIAQKIKADVLTFWNAESLLTTSDSKDVPSASVIECLTYAEATELSFFGSSLIKSHHMVLAMAHKIPLRLRSFATIEHPGTLINADSCSSKDQKIVKGFSVIRDVALINVEGAGMIGVPGIARRLFAAMHDANISVILISQASSEYSICFAVPAAEASLAKEVAQSTFAQEMSDHRIHNIEIENSCAILAAVGQRMSGVPGISGTFFGALGKARVNVRAIAQGSSERNISAVIKEEDAKRALRALHSSFFLSNQTLSVGLFGPGNIGGTLLAQIASEAKRLNDEFGVDIRIRAIANSKKMLLDEQGIDLANWKKQLDKKGIDLDVAKMAKHVSATYFPHAVLIDCTSSSDLPPNYVDWIERGIHIITPNKKAGSAPYPEYKKLMEASRSHKKHFLYETTVGAGLPLIGTLKDLMQTGDRFRSIEGIVSGTLAYLFWRYDGSVPFSTLVKEAKEAGYTEPDPRDDLSGMDVARKTVILAREIGHQVELEDIEVASLVPKELSEVPLDQFMQNMHLMDEPLLQLYKQAEAEGKRLRYVGQVDPQGVCTVRLAAYEATHPFAQSTGTDNVVAFTTERYHTQPLVIQGPGAGPEVTAAGVFADLLRLSSYVGAAL